MSFRVEPGDVYSYGHMIGRAKDDVEAAGKFLKQNTGYDGTGGGSELWGQVVSQHEALTERVEAALTRYQNVLRVSSAELSRSGDYYFKTDRAEAAKVDATYPGGAKGNTEATSLEVAVGFRDREDAQASLAADPEAGFFEARFNGLMGNRASSIQGNLDKGNELAALGDGIGVILDFTSPSALINEGIKLAFNRDILDECAQFVAGDWNEFNNFTKAWEKLAKFFDSVSANVSGGNQALSGTWEGRAAATAFEYFDGLSKKLEELADSLAALTGHYGEIAAQIVSFVNVLKACITTIMDLAIEVALKAAVGTVAGATGVGLIVTAASAASIAYDIVKMLGMYGDILKALTLLYGGINTIGASGMAELEKTLASITNFPLPKESYDHAGV
jgi:uncharacterized protein YukE